MRLFRHRRDNKHVGRAGALVRHAAAAPAKAAVGAAVPDLVKAGLNRTAGGSLGRLAADRASRTAPEAAASSWFGPDDIITAARELNRASGTLAASVLADSAVEHYRGSFENRAMYLPLAASALSVVASLHGIADRRHGGHATRNAISGLAVATGLLGTGFHVYNIGKREGGWSWINLFYAAPVGAPAALSLAGVLGYFAEQLRDRDPDDVTLLGLPAGRTVGAISGLGIAGSVGEAALLHFRGAFQDPFMVLPVIIPPVAAALVSATALSDSPSPRLHRQTSWFLRLTALLGFAGVGFHIFGVSRGMGGWRNWSQNVLNGPPIPAPPSFTGLALAGLAALRLMKSDAHE